MSGDLLSTLFSWWPFVVLIAVWLLITRYSQRTSSGISVIELCEQQLAETQRINVNLERIAAALDKRPQ